MRTEKGPKVEELRDKLIERLELIEDRAEYLKRARAKYAAEHPGEVFEVRRTGCSDNNDGGPGNVLYVGPPIRKKRQEPLTGGEA